METAITKAMVNRDLGQMKEALDKKGLSAVTQEIQRDFDLLEKTTLDIAITGGSGAGKSALVNALRGMNDYEEGAAKIRPIEKGRRLEKYPHPMFPKVTIWELPGIGTPEFKAKEYLKEVHFQKYDFFIITASDRFTVNDVLLAQEIQKMKKKFYYVRSKMDQSIDSEKRNPNFCEEKCLEKIRSYCCDNLRRAGESNPRVFLISRWDLSKYDFPHLQKALETDLDDLKRHALIEAMPAFSKEVLEKKKAAMESRIWKIALLSHSIGGVPVPGFTLACDIGILVATMSRFFKIFGLDEDSLQRLSKRVDKPVDVLRSAIEKSPMASQVTTEFVLDLVRRPSVWATATAVELALDFIPVVRSLTGGARSFVTTFYMLKNFLYDVAEDAENVRAKAAEPQDQ